MAIYTPDHTRIKLTSATFEDVWEVEYDGSITWWRPEPSVIQKDDKHLRIWHVTAVYDEDMPGICASGDQCWLGEDREIDYLHADGGLSEIIDECRRLNPTDAAKEKAFLEGSELGCFRSCCSSRTPATAMGDAS
jgi:hypothetical protein